MEHMTGVASEAALAKAVSKEDSLYLKNIMPILSEAVQTNNIATVQADCRIN